MLSKCMAKYREKEVFSASDCWQYRFFNRMTAEAAQYADTEVEELLTMLRESEHLEEQGDILQYLVDTQGLDFNTGG